MNLPIRARFKKIDYQEGISRPKREGGFDRVQASRGKSNNPLLMTDFGFERECHFSDLVVESIELSYEDRTFDYPEYNGEPPY